MKSFVLISFCFLLLLPNKLLSQVCTGSLGDPVVNIDFGSGTTPFGPALPAGVTNYSYTASAEPSDGLYTIVKSTSGGYGGFWLRAENHTPNDPDGYMMMVNASLEPGVFYETITDKELCANTTYEFAAWVFNLMRTGGIKPNLTFTVLSPEGQPLRTYNTGDIDNDTKWNKKGFLFTSGIGGKVKVRISNNAAGGTGNDLCLDDITFSACGPVITSSIDQSNETEKTFCEGYDTSCKLSVNINGPSDQPRLWQQNTGNGWTDLIGETGTELAVGTAVLPVGTHQYRLVTAPADKFDSPVCRTASPVFTLNINQVPNPVAVPLLAVCARDPIRLVVTASPGDYQWKGPNGFSSMERSPVIENATIAMSGTYEVIVDNEGCKGTAQIKVLVTECHPALVIPNTFTPNGDGVNDLWDIKELPYYPGATVNIYNRYGGKVFTSAAGKSSWDGKCKSSDVPVGTYYYIIDLHNGKKAFSGSVTVLR